MDYGTLIQNFGLPLGFLLVALFSGRAGIWVWGRELDECRAQLALNDARYTAEIVRQDTAWRERYKEAQKDFAERSAKYEAALTRWEQLTLSVSGIAVAASRALEGAVAK